MGRFVRVAATDEIPQGEMKAFDVGHRKFVIAHSSEGFFAVVDECTHDSAPISSGRVRGTEIMCTRHGARFDLKTGAVTAPPAIVPIDILTVKVDATDILVWLE
jgi:3-phenylpropionate/trans-cinnamate dioxygenase ferredoxin subunit